MTYLNPTHQPLKRGQTHMRSRTHMCAHLTMMPSPTQRKNMSFLARQPLFVYMPSHTHAPDTHTHTHHIHLFWECAEAVRLRSSSLWGKGVYPFLSASLFLSSHCFPAHGTGADCTITAPVGFR